MIIIMNYIGELGRSMTLFYIHEDSVKMTVVVPGNVTHRKTTREYVERWMEETKYDNNYTWEIV